MIFLCHHPKLVQRRFDMMRTLGDVEYLVVDWFPPEYKYDIDFSISEGEMSLYLKHRWIYEYIYSKSVDGVHLVIEDDVFVDEDFWSIVKRCSDELELEKGDICFVGQMRNDTNGHVEVPRNRIIGKAYGSRCTHCYLITRKACEKILLGDDIYKINKPIDHKLADICKKIECYWYEPGVKQNPKYESDLQ